MIVENYIDDGILIESGTETKLIPWHEIENHMLRNTLKDKVLVSFTYDYGRYSSWCDRYILDKEYWDSLEDRMIGKTLYLGEIAGKHSDVSYDITRDSITTVDDINKIVEFKKNFGLSSIENDVIELFLECEENGEYDDGEDEDEEI